MRLGTRKIRMMRTKKKSLVLWQLIVIALLVFVPLISKPPEIWEDTAGYLSFASYRPPLYPFFLWLFHEFGTYQLIAVKWAQAIINFIVLLYAGNWMCKRLELPRTLVFLTLLLTVIFFFLHIQVSILGIISEAIAFPLFILTFIFFIESFIKPNIKNIILLVITCNLLILPRDQFYYMYLVLFALIFWSFLKKLPLKKCAVITLIIFSSIFINTLIVGVYHYAINGHFGESSAVGEVLLPPALYLATKDDAQYFTNPLEKEIFLKIENNLTKQQLNYTHVPTILKPPLQLIMSAEWYNLNFNRIKSVAIQSIPPHVTVYTASHIFINISKTLYLHNFKQNFKFYFWRTASSVGGVWVFFSLLIVLCTILFRAITDKQWNPSITQLVIFTASSIILANAAFVNLFSHFDASYYYYSYFLYLIAASLLSKSILQKNN